ncbi:MAG: HemK2/MTQ2 family protein methyltransferase [Nanoarchaeota archaeon]
MIYSPSEDSFLLQKQVQLFSKDKSVLDMGSGSGIQALSSLSAGAKFVLASDVNEEAIKRLKKIKDKRLKIKKSNLFSKIKDKFDLIVFNPPYLPEDKREDSESALITSGGKKGDEILVKFLKQAKNHLNKQGIILIVLSSLTPKKRILKILKDNNMNHSVLSKQNLFMEQLEVWKIEKH